MSSLWGGPHAEAKYFSNFENLGLPLQQKLLQQSRICEFASYMRRCSRHNEARSEGETEAPSKLPDTYANELMHFLEADHHPNSTTIGHNLFCSFVKWQTREYNRSMEATEQSQENNASDANILSPTNESRNEVKRAKRTATKAALASVRTIRADRVTIGRNAAADVHAASYSSVTDQFHCPVCGIGFASGSLLGPHTKVCRSDQDVVQYNLNTGAPGWYKCSNCWMTIQGKGRHDIHEQTCDARPRRLASSSSSDTTCEFCVRAYPFLRQLSCYNLHKYEAHCTNVITKHKLEHPSNKHQLCGSCDKYVHKDKRHRCKSVGNVATKWSCTQCQLTRGKGKQRQHVFDTAHELFHHESTNHNVASTE